MWLLGFQPVFDLIISFTGQHHFPAFRWCRNKGEGWYLPAINELITINKAIHGGKLEKNKEARKRFNKILENNGGKKIGRYNVYFSSTEKDEMKAYAIYFDLEYLDMVHLIINDIETM